MASSSFYSGTGVTPDNTDVDPVAPSNITAIEDSKNAAALSEAAAAASAAASATSASSGAASASTATTKASESAASAAASDTSAAASQASRVASEAAEVAAETAKTAAETARDAASASEVASGAAEVAAETAETNAAASAAAALSSKNAAATSASTASTKATESATSAAASEASNVAAGVAKVAAETAEANAETAQTASETAKTASEAAKVAAETAETNASTSAATATTQAGIATTKAGEASTSATAAEASKVAAAASQVAASNSQVAAASSASSAAAIFDQFDDTYLGSKAVEPTVDNDGNALVTGALFYNSATGGMFIWDSVEWIAASAAGGASLTNFAFTATAGQTTFSGTDDNSNTLTYTQDNLILILNGVILESGTDYTATDGTTIVLTDATVVNDELNVVAFKTFTTADMVSSSNGGTFYSNVDFSAGIDVTGDITVTGTVDGRDVAADGAIIDSLGTAATTASTAYATAAQGALAASATQPGDLATVATTGAYSDLSGAPSPFDPSTLATVATSGAYSDLSGTPTLGTAATTASTDYATAAQGALADSATQPGDLATVATSGAYSDLSGTPTLGTAASSAATDFVAVTGDTMTGNLDITGTLTSDGLIVQATGSNYPLIEHSSGNRIQLQPSYNYYNSFQHTFKNLDGSANTLTIGQTGDLSLYDSTGTTPKFFWDASAESLGIGTSSPMSVALNVHDSTNARIALTNSSTGQTFPDGFELLATGLDAYLQNRSNGNMIFTTNNTEAARLDASGNLLVGTTATGIHSSSSNDGVNIGDGYVSAARNGTVGYFNRQSTDGTLLDFRKNGNAVGSISSRGGVLLQIGSTSYSGLDFGSSMNPLYAGSIADNTVDLGYSGGRFKDLYLSGTANAANFNTTSDATLKTNVETLTGSLDAVKSLRGVSFDWIENGNSEVGVIAQEVETVLPNVVSTNDQGIKSVKYGNMVALLIEAMKEQQLRIEALEAKLGE